jgi:hypothetical protein
MLATNVAGTAVDLSMRAKLRKHVLQDERDCTVIEAPFPTMQAVLVEKKADLVAAVSPFLAPELLKISRTLFTGPQPLGVVATLRKVEDVPDQLPLWGSTSTCPATLSGVNQQGVSENTVGLRPLRATPELTHQAA